MLANWADTSSVALHIVNWYTFLSQVLMLVTTAKALVHNSQGQVSSNQLASFPSPTQLLETETGCLIPLAGQPSFSLVGTNGTGGIQYPVISSVLISLETIITFKNLIGWACDYS